ncbi:MAG: HPF/RaiA family ribosome-associated protein [candidate division KSB1 bacterium]|nr:HPF/RaiA family ribosome-associated protein [candidate division KSB1 bacterium]
MKTEANRAASQFSWNIVTRGLHEHPFLRDKIYSKIRTLEKHLQRFPADAVHLLIEIERHPRKEEHRAVLTLRLPSHILHADKSAKSVISALSNAVKALLQELKSLKERLREEPQWKRKTRRKTLVFARQPSENTAEPQSAAEIRDAFFESHRQPLMRFARRVANRARNQAITDPKLAELVGEAKDKLAALAKRQKLTSGRAQLYRLVRETIAQRAGSLSPAGSSSASSPVAKSSSPQSGLLSAMDQALAPLSSFEQEVFDLHYIDGFEADEIAMITRKPVNQVNQALDTIEGQIRQSLRSESVAE